MDEELRIYPETMETRMMVRINDNQERLIERIGNVEKRLSSVETSVSVLAELARSTNMMLYL